MLFLSPHMYTAVATWWSESPLGDFNDAFLAVFMMWLNTELTYAAVNAFFIYIERKGYFAQHKIRSEASDTKMVHDAIMFKPIAWMVDVPIYYLSFSMMNMNGETSSPLDPMPSAGRIARDTLILTLVFDFLFYAWHRSLHSKLMWRFHKKHHEVRVSFSCANDHESVLELAGNILWKMIPPALLGCHIYTVCVFRSVVKFFALMHHSGYELPVFKFLQYIPFVASPSYHDHHHYHGWGNFGGVFNIWDRVFGTDADQIMEARRAKKRA